jgi:hypothetical protein
MKLCAIFLFCCLSCMGQSDIIPVARTANWSLAGVPGGITTRNTIFVNLLTTTNTLYHCAGDDSTDDSGKILQALTDCPNGQVVYAPTATYRMASSVGISLPHQWTLRGDGEEKTIFHVHTGDIGGFRVGGADIEEIESILSGATLGSSNITVGLNQDFNVDDIGMINQLDDGVFVISVGSQNGGNTNVDNPNARIMSQAVRVTAVSGTSITFWPPLIASFTRTPQIQKVFFNEKAKLVGFEGFTITNDSGGMGQFIYFQSSQQSWVDHVETQRTVSDPIFFYASVQCQMTHCDIRNVRNDQFYTDNSVIAQKSSFLLLENNVLDHLNAPYQINSSTCGSVISYNYIGNEMNGDYSSPAISANHIGFPMFNLYEGNVGQKWQSDFYFGSCALNTLFRNWWSGNEDTNVITAQRACVSPDSHSFSNNIVANVLGKSGITWGNYLPTNANFGSNTIYRMGYPFIGSSSYDTNVFLDQYDPNVISTAIMHDNYNYLSNVVVYDAGISDHMPQNSYYYGSKPSWFGNCPWPGFEPTNVASISITNIPAGWRFSNNTFNDPTNSSPIFGVIFR